MSPCAHSTTTPTITGPIDCIHSIPDPEIFYNKYIRLRQPVHLSSSSSSSSSIFSDVVVVDTTTATTTSSSSISNGNFNSSSIVSILLENPNILQYDVLIRTLQRIMDTYQQRCSCSKRNKEDEDDDDDDDDDFMEQYMNVEVNVKSTTTTTNLGSVNSTTTKMIPTKMSFHDMYQKLFVERNEQYYMTTPTIPFINKELGQPDIMTFITKQILLHYSKENGHPFIPLRPKVMGHLIPMNVGNIWIGCTSNNNNNNNNNSDKNNDTTLDDRTKGSGVSISSSSGLHHDYHDNLYCLLYGTKIIRLTPPESIYHDIEMMGKLHTLHNNGRIVYHEQIEDSCHINITNDKCRCPIRPDGALVSVETILQLEIRKEEIEAELSELSNTNNSESENAKMNMMESLEEELNIIEEQILDIEMSGDVGSKKKNLCRFEDYDNNYDDVNDNIDDEGDENDDEDNDESEEEGIFFGTVGKSSSVINKIMDTTDKNDEKDKEKHEPMQKRVKYTPSEPRKNPIHHTLPPNFVKRYDPSKISFQTITMHAGDALYIPAGWFHEVTSIGEGHYKKKKLSNESTVTDNNVTTDSKASSLGCPDGIHVAINYWYHPPDVVDPSNKSNKRDCNDDDDDIPNFHHPYISKFWQRDWEQRQLDNE